MRMQMSEQGVEWTQCVRRLIRSGLMLAALLAALLAASWSPVWAQPAANWRSVGPPGGTVLSILKSPRSPSLLYAGTSQNGVFMSADAGQTWAAANTGLPSTSGSASRSVRALVSDGQYVYAATDAGIYYAAAAATANDMPTWSAMANQPSSSTTISLLAFEASSGMLFAAATNATPGTVPVVHLLTAPVPGALPSGPWTPAALPPETLDSGIGAMELVPATLTSAAGLLASANDRIYLASVVPGASSLTWVDADAQAQLRATGTVEALHYSADFSQAYACSGGQLFMASNPLDPASNNWLGVATMSPPPAAPLTCAAMASGSLAAGGPALVALATNAGVYLSLDGTNFSAAAPLGVSPQANALVVAGAPATPALYVAGGFGVASQPLATVAPTAAWTANNGPASVSNGVASARLDNALVTDSAVIGTTLFAAIASDQYGDVLSSADAGATWVSTGLSGVTGELVDIRALAADASNRILYAGTSHGLYAWSTSAGTWVPVASANVTSVVALARGRGALYVGTDAGVLTLSLTATPSNAMATDAGLAGLRVSALHVADGKVFAGTYDFNTAMASVAAATDASTGMANWSPFATGTVGSSRITSLALVGTSLLAATRGGLVSIATSGGSWTNASAGLSDSNGWVTSLFSDGTTVFAATRSNGIFAAPAGAPLTWAPFNGAGSTSLPSMDVRQLRAEGTQLYASTAGGLATFDGIVASTSLVPTPAPAPVVSQGGGAVDAWSLVALALLVGLMAALARADCRPD